jgi:hypothetical protein
VLVQETKIATQKEVIVFATQFMDFKNTKQLLRAVKHDLPKLLGFSHANIMMHDAAGKNLYSISIDEEAEKRAKAENKTFEREFVFDEQ